MILMSLFFLASLAWTLKRLLRYLRYLQQEEYESLRFMRWIWKTKAWDSRASLVTLVSMGVGYVSPPHIGVILAAFLLYVGRLLESDPRQEGKLKLIMTARARRIWLLGAFFFATAQFALLSSSHRFQLFWWLQQIALFQLTPLFLVASCRCLLPHENYLQRRLMREAKEKIQKLSPFIIGITGSYGKTSCKHLLVHILQVTLAPTFWPEKGINTLMGVTRAVRNHLKKGHRYGVVEMGAYYRGSIRKLCQLTPPQAAWITGIGLAHLERYQTQGAIEEAKSELAHALEDGAILVCNGDNEGARRIAASQGRLKTYLYGMEASAQDLDCKITSWSIENQGTSFTLLWKGRSYEGWVPQLGRANLSNIAGAWTMACALGADPEYVLAVIRGIESVDNRLKLTVNGSHTYLMDAYNSNPQGFAAALEVMEAYPANHRLLMTPGIIELGQEQYAQNRAIGLKASRVCDQVILVGSTNQQALFDGLIEGGMQISQIHLCENRDRAFALLPTLLDEGDLILIENDLTDLYEDFPRF